MSGLRAPGEPGRHGTAMAHQCGYDGGDDSAPACGKPAQVHLFAGAPDKGPSDYTMMACADHFPKAQPQAWDYHDVGAVCDMPGTIWQSRGVQGAGFCYWPDAEAAMHQGIAEIRALAVTP